MLADSLRTDQHCFRRVSADHPSVVRIRELSRTEDNIGTDLRRTVNQLYQLLLTVLSATAPDLPDTRQAIDVVDSRSGAPAERRLSACLAQSVATGRVLTLLVRY